MPFDWEIITSPWRIVDLLLPHRKQARQRAAEVIRRQAPLLKTSFGRRADSEGSFLSWQIHDIGVGYAKEVLFRISSKVRRVFLLPHINVGEHPHVEITNPSGPAGVGHLEYKDSLNLIYRQEIILKPGPNGYDYSAKGDVARPPVSQLPWSEIKRILATD